jgi:hypothetical protein
MLFASYTEALIDAEKCAELYGRAYMVLFYQLSKEYGVYSMSVVTECAKPGDTTLIVASVDHTGIITESKWVRDMVAGVAA